MYSLFHTHTHTQLCRLRFVFISAARHSPVFITVIDDNGRDSMATLDFPAMSAKRAAAFHLYRALM